LPAQRKARLKSRGHWDAFFSAASGRKPSAAHQHNPPHRTAARPLDAGNQLSLARETTGWSVKFTHHRGTGRCATSFPHLSQVIRKNHEGKAAKGWSRASAGVGRGSVP
jgi:hypothetical protein